MYVAEHKRQYRHILPKRAKQILSLLIPYYVPLFAE